jgi:hypothetical protein
VNQGLKDLKDLKVSREVLVGKVLRVQPERLTRQPKA